MRDPAVPSYSGKYIYGDLCRPQLRLVDLPEGEPRDSGLEVPQLSSFGEDAQGRIYALSLDGPVYRLVER